MVRYNHHVLEKKWLAPWSAPFPSLEGFPSMDGATSACTIFISTGSTQIDLENFRLLILTDFLGYCKTGSPPLVSWLGAGEEQLSQAQHYGVRLVSSCSKGNNWDLAVLPRDYSFLVPNIVCTERFLCGRFLDQIPVAEFLPDFGLDALRVFSLYLGPPTRDYRLNWSSLAAAYHFLQKIWQLGQTPREDQEVGEKEALQILQLRVTKRLQQKKPHTALAAMMEFLRDKTALSPRELVTIAVLLRPYAPFLATELLSLMTPIQNYNGGKGNQTNTQGYDLG